MMDRGRSTLHGKTLTKVMFAYGTHPVRSSRFLEITLYRLHETAFVLCMAEGPLPFDVELSRAGLGWLVAGELIAPYAQRHMEGMGQEEAKKLLEESLPLTVPGIKFEWYVTQPKEKSDATSGETRPRPPQEGQGQTGAP